MKERKNQEEDLETKWNSCVNRKLLMGGRDAGGFTVFITTSNRGRGNAVSELA